MKISENSFNEDFYSLLEKAIEKSQVARRADSGGGWIAEFDYFDSEGISDQTAYDIVYSEDPTQYINDYIFDETYDDWYFQNLNWVVQQVEETLEQMGVSIPEDVSLSEELGDRISIEIADMDVLYNTRINCRLVLNTGDANTEFSDNPYYRDMGDEQFEFEPNCSLLWLCKRLDCKIDNIVQGIRTRSTENMERTESSVVNEVANTTSSLNAVVFLLKCKLMDIIDWKTNNAPITIFKGTTCGLYDPFNGGGSVLDIYIYKDITIPSDVVWEFVPDITTAGVYGVNDVYGLSSSSYKPCKVDGVAESVSTFTNVKIKNESYDDLDHAGTKIYLYITNTRGLMDSVRSVVASLNKKYEAGNYDESLALKAWLNVVKLAITRYNKEEEEPITLTAEQKEMVARALLDRYKEDIMVSKHNLKEDVSTTPNKDKLYDLFDILDMSQLAEELIDWMSDDDVGEFSKAYGYFDNYEDDDVDADDYLDDYEDENGEGQVVEESLNESTEYRDKTKQGWPVLKLGKSSKWGDPIAIIHRVTDTWDDYIVAWMYDVESGTWGQGHYMFDTQEEAEEYARNEYGNNVFESVNKKQTQALKENSSEDFSVDKATKVFSYLMDMYQMSMFDDDDVMDDYTVFIRKYNEFTGNKLPSNIYDAFKDVPEHKVREFWEDTLKYHTLRDVTESKISDFIKRQKSLKSNASIDNIDDIVDVENTTKSGTPDKKVKYKQRV